MSGLEEGLTITIGGLANITDRKKTAYAQVVENTSREETVLRRLKMEFDKDSSQMAEKFETYKAFLKQMAASKKLKFGYTFRRFSQCKFFQQQRTLVLFWKTLLNNFYTLIMSSTTLFLKTIVIFCERGEVCFVTK